MRASAQRIAKPDNAYGYIQMPFDFEYSRIIHNHLITNPVPLNTGVLKAHIDGFASSDAAREDIRSRRIRVGTEQRMCEIRNTGLSRATHSSPTGTICDWGPRKALESSGLSMELPRSAVWSLSGTKWPIRAARTMSSSHSTDCGVKTRLSSVSARTWRQGSRTHLRSALKTWAVTKEFSTISTAALQQD